MHQNQFRQVSSPDPVGELTGSPRPSSWNKGDPKAREEFREGKKEERDGKGTERREKKKEAISREGNGGEAAEGKERLTIPILVCFRHCCLSLIDGVHVDIAVVVLLFVTNAATTTDRLVPWSLY